MTEVQSEGRGGDSPIMDIDAFKQAARRDLGMVVIQAIPGVGPHHACRVQSIVPRQEIQGMIEVVQMMSPTGRKETLDRFVEDVRGVLQRSDFSGEANEFLGNLAILFAFQAVLGSGAIQASGVFDLALDVDPDAALPWERRGMLDPKLTRSLHLAESGCTTPSGPLN